MIEVYLDCYGIDGNGEHRWVVESFLDEDQFRLNPTVFRTFPETNAGLETARMFGTEQAKKLRCNVRIDNGKERTVVIV